MSGKAVVGNPGDELVRLVASVSGVSGALDQAVRRRLIDGEPVDGPLGVIATAVRNGGQAVSDGHIDAARAAGYSDDAVFECVVAAAVGGGVDNIRAVERLLGDRP